MGEWTPLHFLIVVVLGVAIGIAAAAWQVRRERKALEAELNALIQARYDREDAHNKKYGVDK